jgi:propionate CoA-transferase
MASRFSFDPTGRLFFVNFEGLEIRTQADVDGIRQAVEERLAPLGHKVDAIINYDRFRIAPELEDAYAAMVKGLVERHYNAVTRYTSSTHVRLQLAAAFTRSDQPPRLYALAGDA